ncbi:MAG: hypothetical protein HGA75_04555 [Thiobacillus sp.]|nr:hypothetical protein [Thiobacillus sp.]
MLVVGFALAGQAGANDAAASGCSRLMTETECQQHKQTLASLREPEALRAYLDNYLAMLREREVMCSCAGERQVLARAQYR